jgi:hypothetical protein
MELQRGLPFAGISAEKYPLLACIQSRVAAEDYEHFATVWARQTDSQTDIQHSISKSESKSHQPEVNLIAVHSHLKRGAQCGVGALCVTRSHQLCPRGNSIDSSHGGGGIDVGVHRNLDRTLVRQRLGNSSPRGREQSQEDKEKLTAWNLDAFQPVKCFGDSKRTSYAHNQRRAYQDQGHDVQKFAAGQRRGWWLVEEDCLGGMQA